MQTFHLTLEGPDDGYSSGTPVTVTFNDNTEWDSEQIATMKQILATFYDVFVKDVYIGQEEKQCRDEYEFNSQDQPLPTH